MSDYLNRFKDYSESQKQTFRFVLLLILFDAWSSLNKLKMSEKYIEARLKQSLDEKTLPSGESVLVVRLPYLINLLKSLDVNDDIIDQVKALPALEEEGDFNFYLADIERDYLDEIEKLTNIIEETQKFNGLKSSECVKKIFSSDTFIARILSSWLKFKPFVDFELDNHSLKEMSPVFMNKWRQSAPIVVIAALCKLFHVNPPKYDLNAIQMLIGWISDEGSYRVNIDCSNLNLLEVIVAFLLSETNITLVGKPQKTEEQFVFYVFKQLSKQLMKEAQTLDLLNYKSRISANSEECYLSDAFHSETLNGDLSGFYRSVILCHESDFKNRIDLNKIQQEVAFQHLYKIMKLETWDTNYLYLFMHTKDCSNQLLFNNFSSTNPQLKWMVVQKKYTDLQYFLMNYLFKNYLMAEMTILKKAETEQQRLDLITCLQTGSLGNLQGHKNEDFWENPMSYLGYLKLGDVVDIIRGQAITEKGNQSMVFELNPGDINDAGIIGIVKKYLSDINPEKYERYRIKKGDIVIGVKGLVGRVGLVDHEVDNLYAGQAIAILRRKTDCSYPAEYLFTMLRQQLSNFIELSGLRSKKSKTLLMDNLRDLMLPYPDRNFQDYVNQVHELFHYWRSFEKLNHSMFKNGYNRDLNSLIILTHDEKD